MGLGVLRRWQRHPRLAVHHLATITLGMAAVTAIVSLMLAMAFQPLPFHEAARLVQVWDRVQSGAPVEALSGAELTEFGERTDTVFESLGGFLRQPFVLLEDGGSAITVQVARLEEGAFRALDLTPVLGPAVSDAASVPGGLGSVWISRNLWQSRFGGNPSVVGRTIRLAQDAAGTFETRSEVAGVLPADIRIPHPGGDAPVDVWAILPSDLKQRGAKARLFFALGRLLPERTVADAQAALTVIADGRPGVLERRNRPVVRSFEDVAYGPARRTIGVLVAGVGLVLLLALANLASLTVAEGQRRRVELAVRISLGASRARLWRDLAAEHVALTLCALGLGLPLAWVAVRGLTRLAAMADIGPALPQPPDLEPWILCTVSACALAAALVWATLIVRALESSNGAGVLRPSSLAGTARTGTADRRAGMLRLGVLSVQACVGVALMVLAVSMARIYGQLTAADLGPAPDRTSFFSVRAAARTTGPPTAAGASAFTAEVRSVLQRLPDVRAMAVAESFPPLRTAAPFWKPDDPVDAPRETTYPSRVSDDYFSTLGIPIVFGRGFDESDRYGGRDVAVIDLEMARRNWDTPEDAVNGRILVGGSRRPYDVIGVAGSFGGYWVQAPVPAMYLSLRQDPSSSNVVILRTAEPARDIAERARQALAPRPGGVEVSAATTLLDGWQATATRPRARMVGMLLLALVGIALGAQGVYALAASIVAARRQELAIRSALGAAGRTLVWLVLWPLVVAVATGGSAGVLAIVALPRLAPPWISAALGDPVAPILTAIVVLLATAVLGGLVPARSALRAAPGAWLRGT